MAIKEANEITVKVLCSNEELIEQLIKNGFKEKTRFSMDDSYFIPDNLELNILSAREILSKAIIIRYIEEKGINKQMITFKKKEFNENGDILSQQAFNCIIKDNEEAKILFSQIGYKEIMNIKEQDIVYYKDSIELAVKYMKGYPTLIEFETDEHFQTVEDLIYTMDSFNLDIEKGNYFVKKAEMVLNQILKESVVL
ncbi:MAG: hypothetical protein HUJ53_03365 [Holdemanella sp.]|nr:hypothetical protein [Holdemanella sp.]